MGSLALVLLALVLAYALCAHRIELEYQRLRSAELARSSCALRAELGAQLRLLAERLPLSLELVDEHLSNGERLRQASAERKRCAQGGER